MENNEHIKCTLNGHIDQSNLFESAANFKRQIGDLKSVFKSLSMVENFDIELCWKDSDNILRLIRSFDWVKNQKETIYFVKIKKLIDARKITNQIKFWLNSLRCSYNRCSKIATVVYKDENSDLIYCDNHRNRYEHNSKPFYIENELNESKHSLYDLERRLVLIQERVCFINSKDVIRDFELDESKINELNEKFDTLKRVIKNMKENVKNIVQKSRK